MDTYEQFDAIGLASLVRSGAATPIELLEAAIQRIELHNPTVNAVVHRMFDSARADITRGLAMGPLAGVPYLVKDLNMWIAGVPATNGSRGLRHFIPSADSELVKRLRSSGLVLTGKCNTPEFGLNVCTSPILFGPTHNPAAPGRSAGGSSGGSAAAVASAMVPAAHATDSAGSIRIPASNCGLFGLKPSRARVPLGHGAPEGVGGLSTGHALTHSVRDSALLLDIASGPVSGDPYAVSAASQSYLQAVEQTNLDRPLATSSGEALRVALCITGFAGEAVDPACAAAAIHTGKLCEQLGAIVEPIERPVDGAALRDALKVVFSANMDAAVKSLRSMSPDMPIDELVEPITLAASYAGANVSASAYIAALGTLQHIGRQLGALFERYDILLSPTLTNPPLALGELSMLGTDWDGYIERMLDEIAFTPLFNATGAPAASLPLGKSPQDWPIGVQIGAAFGREDLVLKLSRALEIAAPWHQLR